MNFKLHRKRCNNCKHYSKWLVFITCHNTQQAWIYGFWKDKARYCDKWIAAHPKKRTKKCQQIPEVA